MKKYKDVKYKDRREELICHFRTLSDKDFQLKNWVKDYRDDAYWWGLHFPISMIFDELDIEYDPESLMEWYLKTEDELKSLLEVANILDRIMNEIGQKRKDSDYINSPLFEEMIKISKNALDVFMANETDNEELKKFFTQRYGEFMPKE